MTDQWEKAGELLKNGGVVILPSESSYGIAALVNNEEAIRKLYQIKKRSDNKPSLVIVGSVEQAKEFVNFSNKGLELANKFWPGGLTLVLDSKVDNLPDIVYGEGKSLAIRLSGLEQLRSLALAVGPFVLPSANFNAEQPPFKLEEINPELAKLVDYVLEEPTQGNSVSTLVDVRGEKLVILRQGAITLV